MTPDDSVSVEGECNANKREDVDAGRARCCKSSSVIEDVEVDPAVMIVAADGDVDAVVLVDAAL